MLQQTEWQQPGLSLLIFKPDNQVQFYTNSIKRYPYIAKSFLKNSMLVLGFYKNISKLSMKKAKYSKWLTPSQMCISSPKHTHTPPPHTPYHTHTIPYHTHTIPHTHTTHTLTTRGWVSISSLWTWVWVSQGIHKYTHYQWPTRWKNAFSELEPQHVFFTWVAFNLDCP